MSKRIVNHFGRNSKVCYFSAVLQSARITKHLASDDMVEKELDIKLDITKKSRRINRPVQFADQHGEVIEIKDLVALSI